MAWSALGDGESLAIQGGGLVDDDASNLVIRAIRLYRKAVPFSGHVAARLIKRVPIGAGLGGGSSDAAAALRGLQEMWGSPLEPSGLAAMAKELGADVPFFLGASPALMRGIGDVLEPRPEWRQMLERYALVIFRPLFGVSTPWAYRRLADSSKYADPEGEEALYRHWNQVGLEPDKLPANSFREVVGWRYPTIPVVLNTLNALPGVVAEMSGSGSACFALCETDQGANEVQHVVSAAWGPKAFCEGVRFW